MNDDQLLRYSRQIMLPSIGIEGQEKLLQSRVVIFGLGGLGSPAAMYLAAAGIGELVLVDFDRVDLTNLQRQIIHTTGSIGQLKVDSARQTLRSLNPECRIETVSSRLEGEELEREIRRADLVIDGTDNFTTRFAINAACVAHRIPLVSGAAIRMEGQVSVFTGQADEPCYRCLYGSAAEMDETCSANGVLSPLVGIIGSVQALEAIKVLTGSGHALVGRLLVLDALEMQWRTLILKKDPACKTCGGH
ncbi:HesA/MoeB/ThiF family protein [Sedimenticola hydrogenitrophicus]|uniref:HesA/MoeB/ThiF family protein n=1 Tax=Sedimenticola hydrogenitrophicus TaxID=2967975 RepID=UPI0023AFDE9E|nr:molybdopterin-synthase adenylyltransferase MoeB [Sedimenticola hydrogenitrophicus]